MAVSACAIREVKPLPHKTFDPFGLEEEVKEEPPAPIPTNDNLNATLWVQTSTEYRTMTRQAYKLAEIQLKAALKDRKWTASLEQTEKFSKLVPAVILDVDETVLDNSPYQARLIKNDDSFNPTTWAQWVAEKRAKGIAGALEFCNFAKENNVKVFYVTNRTKELEADTRANLEALGFPLEEEDTLLMKNEREDWGSAKGTRRIAVGERHRILLLIGDNLGDFVDGYKGSIADRSMIENEHAEKWGVKWIVLPNPTYGSWVGAIFKGMEKPITDEQRAKKKYDTLED
jgi:acid phosphatase